MNVNITMLCATCTHYSPSLALSYYCTQYCDTMLAWLLVLLPCFIVLISAKNCNLVLPDEHSANDPSRPRDDPLHVHIIFLIKGVRELNQDTGSFSIDIRCEKGIQF
jgi:hypothetical protein